MTAAPSATEVSSTSPTWPLWKRLELLFTVAYRLLYMTAGLSLNWRPAMEWAAWTVLRRVLPVPPLQNGSGDTLKNYVLVELYLVVSLAITLRVAA